MEKREKHGEHKGALHVHISHRGEKRSRAECSNPQFNTLSASSGGASLRLTCQELICKVLHQ